ncbi:MAG TPA: ATPase domain-containing protein [Candidatus Binatia bacterium]|nr:ATPase domain-containing protein [Candidatus Binatia bacterium]
MQPDSPAPLDTGIEGLNQILRGGLPPGQLYLLEGHPGTGKTTLAMQFLMAGVRNGESVLFVALSEDERELRASAASHGWDLAGVDMLEIVPGEENLRPDARYTMYHPAEVELAATTKMVLAETEKRRPSRIVFDSLSELRLMAEDSLRYRRQILALKHHFTRLGATVILIDDRTGDEKEMHLHSLAHGVISLERVAPEYGTSRRRMQVAKLRGRAYAEGYHDFSIVCGGIQIFPRLIAADYPGVYLREEVRSGSEGLDSLLGGGLAKGTSTLILGAAGTGKSSLAGQYVCAAAARGEKAMIMIFEESLPTFVERSRGLGMDVTALQTAGRLEVQRVDPAQLTPGEFSHLLRQAIEHSDVTLVVIDSLNGYLNAMPNERFLTLHLHELLSYLSSQGVTTLLTMTNHGLVGADINVPVDASYLADNVLTLRYFEAFGQVRKAISVIKKRTGSHETSIREIWLDGRGIHIGEPIREFQGVLTGTPMVADRQLGGIQARNGDGDRR